MWRIWFFFGILKISFGAPVETSQEDIIPASELSVLKCLLSSPINSCDDVKRSITGEFQHARNLALGVRNSARGFQVVILENNKIIKKWKNWAEKIPKRLQKIYEKLKRPLFNVSNEVVDSNALEALPASLLYLIPKVRLSSMTGFIASDIVRKFPFDDALAMKILSLFTDKTNIRNFLNGLADREEVFFVSDDEVVEEESIGGLAPISPAVEQEIALSLSVWFPNGSQWEYWLYKASMISGTPILASLPNYFLKSLSLETTEKFLFHVRNWRWDYSKFYDSAWSQHSMAVKRVWSSIVLHKAEPPSRWTPKILRQFGFFLIGATPDELRELSPDLRISHDFDLLLELDWNALQARAVFDVGFSGLSDLSQDNLHKGKNIVLYLLPRQIQQFSHNATDFSFVKPGSGISLPTEKQVFESYLAFLLSKNRTKDVSPPTLWKNHVTSAGKFYHLLPASALEVFANESLDLETLAKIDCPSLTYRQANYLSNSGNLIDLMKPETVVKFKGMLKAVPSVKLIQLPANMVSQSVKEHLLMFSSGNSLPFGASIVEKVRQDLALTSYLEKMLYSKDFRENFNLLSNRDITEKFRDINSNLFDIVSKNPVLERNIRLLPQSTLSALLSMHRREAIFMDGGWTYENLVESPLKLYVLGLTCTDIEVLETSDFVPVIRYYVHQRRAMNQVFPKNMQYCSQKALTKYLKLKMSLRGLTNEPIGLLELLEPHEIRAVGGYILASLPVDVIDTLASKYQIIYEIGKLTIPELLTATSVENLNQLTEIYVSHAQLNLRLMNGLGNLIWFLSEKRISKLDVEDFRLYLESMEENAGKALCLNESERKAWKQLLIRTFGKPDSWSSGTLSFLGDLLLVFDSYELERINRTSWMEAADVLAKSTSFYTLMEWPGKSKPIYLFESCLEILRIPERISYKSALKQLLRYYLESAQFLLETVSSAQTILKLHEQPNLVENAPSMGSPLITTLVINHPPALVDQSESITDPFDYYSEEDSSEEDGDDKSDAKEDSGVANGESRSTESGTTNSQQTSATQKIPIATSIPQSKPIADDKQSVEYDQSEKDDVKIFRSSITKSMEELKEEMQRNASRALIIEVPVNRSEFLNFPIPTKRHVKISCDAIRLLGLPASLILDAKDVENMDEIELEDCVEVLGSLELEADVKRLIWSKLKKWQLSGNLKEVGGLTSEIEENDISKIPLRLSEPWALENLHVLSTHITEPEMMSFITDQFLLKNMDLQALTYESAISLSRLVCTMTLSHQRKYLLNKPGVFVSVAKTLGSSLSCGSVIFDSCIQQLASIAASPEAFGEVHKWTANDVSDLGVIVAGLKKSDWQEKNEKGLKTEAFAGLTPGAVSCIPPDVFRVFTEEQLLRIPALSTAAVSSEQTSSLSPSQFEIIDRIRRQVPPDDLTASFTSGSPRLEGPFYVSVTVCVSVFFASRTFLYL